MLDKDHQAGHRNRLKEKFIKNGKDALHDYELLELLLFFFIPRRDVKSLAKNLLKNFRTLNNLLNAKRHELLAIPGLTENLVTGLTLIKEMTCKVMEEQIREQPVLNCWQEVINYCKLILGNKNHEEFHVIFLNLKNMVIATELSSLGTIDQAPVYVREVIKRALDLGASSLIMIHNHPSGDPKPSNQDIQITKIVKEACEKIGITLFDHLIIGRYGFCSLKSLGCI